MYYSRAILRLHVAMCQVPENVSQSSSTLTCNNSKNRNYLIWDSMRSSCIQWSVKFCRRDSPSPNCEKFHTFFWLRQDRKSLCDCVHLSVCDIMHSSLSLHDSCSDLQAINLHAIFMHSSCILHAFFMQSSCNLLAIYMQSSCNLHAFFMQSSCNFHAIFM